MSANTAKFIAEDLFKDEEFRNELIIYICDDIERFTSVAKICILLNKYNIPYNLHVEAIAHFKTLFYDEFVVPDRLRYSLGSQWVQLDDIKEGLKYYPGYIQHGNPNRLFNSNSYLEENNG